MGGGGSSKRLGVAESAKEKYGIREMTRVINWRSTEMATATQNGTSDFANSQIVLYPSRKPKSLLKFQSDYLKTFSSPPEGYETTMGLLFFSLPQLKKFVG